MAERTPFSQCLADQRRLVDVINALLKQWNSEQSKPALTKSQKEKK